METRIHLFELSERYMSSCARFSRISTINSLIHAEGVIFVFVSRAPLKIGYNRFLAVNLDIGSSSAKGANCDGGGNSDFQIAARAVV